MGLKTCQKFVILTSFGLSFRWCPKRRVYVCQDEFLWQNLSKGHQVEQSNICQFQIIFIYFPPQNAKKDTIKITDPKVQYWILQWQIGDICTFIN